MKKLSKRYHLNTLMKTLCVLLLAITLLPLAAQVKAEESKVTNLFGSSLMDQQGYILTMVSAGTPCTSPPQWACTPTPPGTPRPC